jgi:hypothetical protein
MLFGHNTNVTVNGVVIHVQTEDRGLHSAVLDTTVYYRGRVLHRRTSKYHDLLPLDPDREQVLKLRLDDQHSTVVEGLRSGTIPVDVAPPAPPAAVASIPPLAVATNVPNIAAVAHPTSAPAPGPEKTLIVDLLNPRTWLTGRQATLYLIVRDKASNSPVTAARVTSRVDGGADKAEVTAMTDAEGNAQLQFEMPRLTGEDAALVIEAATTLARGHLRFQLRAKPKVPTTT